jgi:hypothetical protein
MSAVRFRVPARRGESDMISLITVGRGPYQQEAGLIGLSTVAILFHRWRARPLYLSD